MSATTPFIVLHHGLMGGARLGRLSLSTYRGLDRLIARGGYRVAVSGVHPCAGIDKRAGQLRQWILDNRDLLGEQRIILVAHSLGGLDARYMLARLGMAERVQTLLTVSAPHRGSPYADYWFKHFWRRLPVLRILQEIGLDLRAISDLTTENCTRFNEEITDVPGVKYFSISGAVPRNLVTAFGRKSWDIVNAAQGANDGLVAVQSAIWATHLGTWSADHWQQVNRKIPRARNLVPDISPFYLEALKTVAAESR
jgi:triacylglycerol lipase